MAYLLQDLTELAVCQMRHDWEQIKDVVRWSSDHYMGVSFAIIGIPTLGLLLLEAVCWLMLREQNAALDVLTRMMR